MGTTPGTHREDTVAACGQGRRNRVKVSGAGIGNGAKAGFGDAIYGKGCYLELNDVTSSRTTSTAYLAAESELSLCARAGGRRLLFRVGCGVLRG
jgi:hypothetical protein